MALALVPSVPASVFARLGRLENGCDIDVSLSVEFADGTLATISGNGRVPWGVRTPMSIFLETEAAVMSIDYTNEFARAWAATTASTSCPTPTASTAATRCAASPDARVRGRAGRGPGHLRGARTHADRALPRPAGVDRAPGELGVRAVAIMEAAVESARRGAAVETGLVR